MDTTIHRIAPRVAGVLALLGCAALGSTLLVGETTPPFSAPAVQAGSLAWPVGAQQAYALRIESDLVVGGSRVTHAIEARLDVEVRGVDDKGVRLACALRDVRAATAGKRDAGRERALGAPFDVTMARDGCPTSFAFAAALGDEAQTQIAEVFKTFQLTVPATRGGRWTTVESDALGSYRAVYTQRAGQEIEKRKAAYVSSTNGAEIEILGSHATFRLGAAWLASAEVREERVVTTMGQRVRVRTVATLGRWTPGSMASRAPTATGGGDAVPEEERVVEENQEATAGDLLARLREGQGENIAALHALAALLARHPELAAAVTATILDPTLPDRVASDLVHALELAGTPSCQAELRGLAQDSAVGRQHRLRALVALGGVTAPTHETLAQLTATAHDPDRALSSTAWLALGRTAAHLRAGGSAEYASVAEQLSHRVAAAGPVHERVLALRALANTGDPNLADAALAHVDAPRTEVRAAAVRALADLGHGDSAGALTQRLALESKPEVRTEIAHGLSRLGASDTASLTACRDALVREPDRAARGALARHLVDHLPRFPDARSALEGAIDRSLDRADLAYVAGRLWARPPARP